MKEKKEDFFFSGSFRSLEKTISTEGQGIQGLWYCAYKKAKWNQELLRERGHLCQIRGSAEPSPRLHTPTASPLGGQAVFIGLKAHQGTSHRDYGLLPTAIPQEEREQKIWGNWRAAFFKSITATLKCVTTQLRYLACCFSLKETGRGKQRYLRVHLKVQLLSLWSHTLHDDTASGTCQRGRRKHLSAPHSLKYWASHPRPHLLSLLLPFLPWDF